MNKDEQNLYDSLKSPQQIALDLRLEGKSYKDIASHPLINLQEHTIRTWFMNKGVCRQALEQKKKIRSDEREEYYRGIEDEVRDLGRDAMLALRESINKGNTTAIIKALEISGISKTPFSFKVEQVDEGGKLLGGSCSTAILTLYITCQ